MDQSRRHSDEQEKWMERKVSRTSGRELLPDESHSSPLRSLTPPAVSVSPPTSSNLSPDPYSTVSLHLDQSFLRWSQTASTIFSDVPASTAPPSSISQRHIPATRTFDKSFLRMSDTTASFSEFGLNSSYVPDHSLPTISEATDSALSRVKDNQPLPLVRAFSHGTFGDPPRPWTGSASSGSSSSNQKGPWTGEVSLFDKVKIRSPPRLGADQDHFRCLPRPLRGALGILFLLHRHRDYASTPSTALISSLRPPQDDRHTGYQILSKLSMLSPFRKALSVTFASFLDHDSLIPSLIASPKTQRPQFRARKAAKIVFQTIPTETILLSPQ